MIPLYKQLTFSLNNINRLIFVMETRFFELRTELSDIIYMSFLPQSVEV
jgi:hypothetical protein